MVEPARLEAIADGLARAGFAVVENFLLATMVDKILNLPEFKNVSMHFSKAGVGKNASRQVNESIRGDYLRWIDHRTAAGPLGEYIQDLHQLIGFINQSLFLSLKGLELHLTCYPAGAHYKRHLDQFRSGNHRKLSVICYLNSDWQESHGGALRVYLPEGPVDILPAAGRLVCFRSDSIEHEVLPATRQRLSITGWLLDQIADIK